MRLERLINALWADRDAVDDPMGLVRTHITQLRRVLVPLGIIIGRGRKGYEGYHLAIMTPEEARAEAKKIRGAR